MEETSESCPVCRKASTKYMDWSLPTLKASLERKVGSAFPEGTGCPNYSLRKCNHCTLSFSSPNVPGDAVFYRWITAMPNYYKVHRWEWDETVRRALSTKAVSLLDVGCGTGVFLDYVSSRTSIRPTGVDTLRESVDACLGRGHRAVCLTLEEYLESDAAEAFDMVTAFHCLEHVSDPVGLLKSMAQALRPGGQLVVSVPYSPPSWELLETDCLNMPPHHLTRWNARSLTSLGDMCGLRTEVSTDGRPSDGPLLKSIFWLFRETCSLDASVGFFTTVRQAFRHPMTLFKCARFLLLRDRVGTGRAGNTAFAVFTRPQAS